MDVSKTITSTADINDSAVTSAKIADSNVTTAKIAELNVTTAKIANGNVTADKLAVGTSERDWVLNRTGSISVTTDTAARTTSVPIGGLIFARPSNVSEYLAGSTRVGSGLYPSNQANTTKATGGIEYTVATGTFTCLGYSNGGASTLWIRTS